jgi:hypothetical protein
MKPNVRVLTSVLAASLGAACARPKPIVYQPQQPVEASTTTAASEPASEPTHLGEAASEPKPTGAHSSRVEFAVPTLPSGLVLYHSTFVWTDLAGAVWTMAADGSSKPKKLSDQHREGLASHPFVAGERVLAKAGKQLVAVDVPNGPVSPVKITGLPGKPEDLVGDAQAIYVTVFEHPQIYRVPVGGGAAKHLVDVPRGILALRGDTLYVASYETGAVLAVPTSGGAPRTIARGLARPTALAVDDAAAYVYTEGDQRIQRVELKGGATSVLGEHFNNSDELDVADSVVYTVNWPGKVERLPNTAGGSAMTLADDLHTPRAIVTDDHWVYVTTDEPPRIVRLPK